MKIKVFLLAVFSLFIIGCTSSPTPTKVFFKNSIKKQNMRIYVDNSMDLHKQEKVVNAFIYALKKIGKFKVQKTPDYIGRLPWIIKERTSREIIENPDGSFQTKSWLRGYNIANFDNFQYINTYNYKFKPDVTLSDADNGVLSFDKRVFYPKRDYKISKVDNTSFEISGFKTKKEAIDIWLQLKREIQEVHELNTANDNKIYNYIHKYLLETDTGDDYLGYYYGSDLSFDGKALEFQNKLILRPMILNASLKDMLTQELEKEGYTIVNNIKKANTIIFVQNLFFSRQEFLSFAIKDIQKRFEEKKIKIVNVSDLAYSLTSLGESFNNAGYSNLGAISAALGVLSLFDTSEYNYVAVNYVVAFQNGKQIYTDLVVGPQISTVSYKYPPVQSVYDLINYKQAIKIYSALNGKKD